MKELMALVTEMEADREELRPHVINCPPPRCRTGNTSTHRSFSLTLLVLIFTLLSFSRLCHGNVYSLLLGLYEKHLNPPISSV